MSLYRFTSLARPLDPAWPTNRAVLLALPATAVVFLLATGLTGGFDVTSLNRAVLAALAALGGWALVRELAPDDDPAAFVGLTGAVAAYWLVPNASLLLLFTVLMLVRIANRTVGLPARLTDSLAVSALAGWTVYSTHIGLLCVVAALAFASDATLPPALRRQWLFVFAWVAGAVAAALYGWPLFAARPWVVGARTAVLAAALALFVFRIARTGRLWSKADATGEPLSAARVRAGMGLVALTVAPTLVGGTLEVAPFLLVWTSLGSLALGALRRRSSRTA
jgi:hypothetical protein